MRNIYKFFLYTSLTLFCLRGDCAPDSISFFPSDDTTYNATNELIKVLNKTEKSQQFQFITNINSAKSVDSINEIVISQLSISTQLPPSSVIVIDDISLGVLSRNNSKEPDAPDNITSLRRIIVMYSSFLSAAQKLFPNAQVILNTSYSSSLKNLRSGAVDGIISDKGTVDLMRRYTHFSSYHFHLIPTMHAYIFLKVLNPSDATFIKTVYNANSNYLYRSIYEKWLIISLTQSLSKENNGVSFVLTGILMLSLVLLTFIFTHLLRTRREISKKLDDALQFWESLIQSIPTPTLVTTPDGTITHVNHALIAYLNSHKNEIIGTNLREFSQHYTISPSLDTRLLVDAITHPQPHFTDGSIFVNGLNYSLLQWISVIHDTKFVPKGLIIGWLDITQRKKLEEELANALTIASRASAEKSRFLAQMSHELRSPLNVITGILETEIQHDPLKGSLLSVAGSAANQLLDTIGNILDLSKIEAGELNLHLQATSLELVFEDIINNFKFLAKQKNLSFEFAISGINNKYYLCDKVKISHVITNLLSNAVKYTTEGNIHLVVTCSSLTNDKDEINITVRDTGIGIAQNDIPLILKAYKQVDDSIPKSTGLGLSITHQLVSLMDGHLSVESQQGHGSEFHVKIPLIVTMENALIPPSIMRLPSKLVLAVDDLPANLTVLSLQLEKLGHRVITASDGSKALALLKSQTVDIIITDCQMEPVDGYTLAQEVRKLETDTTRTYFILGVTANAFSDEESACLQAGMDALLIKPFKSSILEHALSFFDALNHIDLKEVNALAGNKKNRLMLLKEIISGNHEEMIKLATYADGDDTHMLKTSLHKIKGSYGLVDFIHGMTLCEEIERQIKMRLPFNISLLKLQRSNYHFCRLINAEIISEFNY